MQNVFKGLFLTVLIGLMTMVSGTDAQARSEKLSVVATTGMLADAVRQVGGDLVEVRALMGPGVDPHAYRQTRSDILAMTKSDLVIWHGLYLEAQMEEFLLKLAKRNAVVAVAETLPEEMLLRHDVYDNRFDPHLWMAPDKWQLVITAIADALVDAAPEAEDDIRANAASYSARVSDLAGYAEARLSSVPSEARVLITAHDAFKYFGAAYDFDVLGIQGISTESEAGLSRIRDLVDILVQRDIRAVFVESSVADRNVKALIEGAASRGHKVMIGGELYSDAMGAEGTYEGTYLGMMDHNITLITQALGGSAPDQGMQGRLASGT